MEIRLLEPSDTRAYKALRLLSLQTDPDAYFTQYEQIVEYGDSFFASEIRLMPPIYGYYGAFEDETLLGYVSLAKPYFPVQFHIADIFNLYVRPEHRGKGVAKQLLSLIINKARKENIESLFLTVIDTNQPAIALYASFGFKEFGRKPYSVKKGAQYFDEVLLFKLLHPDDA